jgi:U5 small nuclear ribonucleoprotein component
MGNVGFSSSLHGWFFTLQSFARLYVDHVSYQESKKEEEEDEEDEDDFYSPKKRVGMDALGKHLSVEDFAQRLWGDCYLDTLTSTFKKRARDCENPNTPKTFIQFILEPMYKMYSVCLGESEATVNKTLRKLGVLLSKDQLRMSPRPLLRAAFQKFFGHFGPGVAGFVDMLVQHTYVYSFFVYTYPLLSS